MPRKSPYALIKVTLNLREGDMERLRELHPHTAAGEVIRLLVRRHIDAASVITVPDDQIELPL